MSWSAFQIVSMGSMAALLLGVSGYRMWGSKMSRAPGKPRRADRVRR